MTKIDMFSQYVWTEGISNIAVSKLNVCMKLDIYLPLWRIRVRREKFFDYFAKWWSFFQVFDMRKVWIVYPVQISFLRLTFCVMCVVYYDIHEFFVLGRIYRWGGRGKEFIANHDKTPKNRDINLYLWDWFISMLWASGIRSWKFFNNRRTLYGFCRSNGLSCFFMSKRIVWIFENDGFRLHCFSRIKYRPSYVRCVRWKSKWSSRNKFDVGRSEFIVIQVGK